MEEPYLGGSDLRVDLAQRRNVIQDPKGAAVRGDHQIVVMHDEVADRSSGHIEPQRLPGIAIIEGDVDAQFRAGIEQAFAYRIFADAIEEAAFGNAGGGALPGFAEVTRTVEIWFQVFEAVTVDRGVRGGSVEMRSFDVRDFAPGREFRRSDVAPGLAFVLRELDQPVVGAGPNFTGLDGGRCDGVNDAAALPFRRVRRRRGCETGIARRNTAHAHRAAKIPAAGSRSCGAFRSAPDLAGGADFARCADPGAKRIRRTQCQDLRDRARCSRSRHPLLSGANRENSASDIFRGWA